MRISHACASIGITVLLVAGCRTGAAPSSDYAASSSRPEAPTAGVTSISVESSAGPNLGSNLPIAPLFRNEEIFGSVDEMATASIAIVLGEVVAVESLGTPDAIDDPHASEYFLVTVHPDIVVKGEPDQEISFVWEGFLTDGGVRTARIVQDGVSMPDVADQLLLFLLPENPDRVELFGGKASYQVATLDGIVYVEDGTLVTHLNAEWRPAHELNSLSVDTALETLVAVDQLG